MLTLFTIVLDGEPFIERHLPIFERLTIHWRWIIAEGAAMNTACTSWCKEQEPRLSRDGTSEYLNSIAFHPNVNILRKQAWSGKVEQCNACLSKIKEPCVLMQLDVDEFWTTEQLERIEDLFETCTNAARMLFCCNYYVGPKVVITPENDPENNIWLRAWRFTPGDSFLTHEPPHLKQKFAGVTICQQDTMNLGLVFEHYSYVNEKQVRFKGEFYGYPNAVKHWRELQENTKWPVELKRFFPWAKEGALAIQVMKLAALLLLLTGCTPSPKLIYVTNLDPTPTQADQKAIMQRQNYKLALELAYAQLEAKRERAQLRWRLSQTKTNYFK